MYRCDTQRIIDEIVGLRKYISECEKEKEIMYDKYIEGYEINMSKVERAYNREIHKAESRILKLGKKYDRIMRG